MNLLGFILLIRYNLIKKGGDMPNWNKILTEVEASNQINALEKMRKEYFEIIHRETGRNVISYYSGCNFP